MMLFALNLVGGGADYACPICLEAAQTERRDQLVSIALVDIRDEPCGWCGESRPLLPSRPTAQEAPGRSLTIRRCSELLDHALDTWTKP